MSRSQEYTQGYRAAVKDAVTWLHQRSAQMNDPQAKRVLDSAAFGMGVAGAFGAAPFAIGKRDRSHPHRSSLAPSSRSLAEPVTHQAEDGKAK
jgi:hypothetical protein